MTASDRLARWGPVIAWAAVIFAFSSVSNLSTGLGTWDLVLRKLAHLTEYAILGGLAYRAAGRVWVAVAFGSLYAVTDELHQAFVEGRVASPVDWALDTVGVVAGVLLVARALR